MTLRVGFWSQISQIRIYHLGPGNILQEYAYSESRENGNPHTLKIVLNPTSSIAAVRHQDDGICICYQGQFRNPLRDRPSK